MPKLSLEGTIGLLMEIILLVLDRLGIRTPILMWGLFGVGFVLISDAVLRGEFSNASHLIAAQRKNRKLLGMIAVLIAFGLFGIFIYTRTTAETLSNAEVRSPALAPAKRADDAVAPVPIQRPTTMQQPKQSARSQKQKNSGGTNNQQQQQNSGGTNAQQQSSGDRSPNVSAPNGIAIGGSNFGNATVNNFRPPLPGIRLESSSPYPAFPAEERKSLPRMLQNYHVHPGVSVQFIVKDSFLNPAFVADCSVPCQFVKLSLVYPGRGEVSYGEDSQAIGTENRMSAGVIYAKPLPAGMHITLEFESLDNRPLTVTNLRPIQE